MPRIQSLDDVVIAPPAPSLGERLDRLGARMIGAIMAIYGLAVVYEIVRSYVLVV